MCSKAGLEIWPGHKTHLLLHSLPRSMQMLILKQFPAKLFSLTDTGTKLVPLQPNLMKLVGVCSKEGLTVLVTLWCIEEIKY